MGSELVFLVHQLGSGTYGWFLLHETGLVRGKTNQSSSPRHSDHRIEDGRRICFRSRSYRTQFRVMNWRKVRKIKRTGWLLTHLRCWHVNALRFSKQTPLLVRRGGRDINKMPRSLL